MRIYSSMEHGSLAPGEWDEFAKHPSSGNLLQSWTWGEFKAAFGWQPVRIAVAEGGRILAAAQVLFRPLPLRSLTTAYIPRGPLLDFYDGSESVSAALLSALHGECRRKRAVSLKVEPGWEDGGAAHGFLRLHSFVPSAQTVQPRRTVLIDLLPDEGTILAQMKPKTRYNIRLAQRKEVSVRLGTADDLAVFYELLQVTGRRDGFGIHTRDYYARVWQLFAAQDAVALLLAEWQGRVLAGLMVFSWGRKAWYMYGASADEQRQRMPNHLLQWEAMRWAKARGCTTYDLWGIPDVDERQVGPEMAAAEEQGVLRTGLGGLYRFKKGFGGTEVRYVGAYDYVYNRPLYRLMTAAWSWRRK